MVLDSPRMLQDVFRNYSELSKREQSKLEKTVSQQWEPDVACRMAVSDAVDFLEAISGEVQETTVAHSTHSDSALKWEKPCSGCFKINFEGGDHCKRTGGLGIVIRDSNGSFRAARAIHLGNITEPMIIEAMTSRESLIFRSRAGIAAVNY